MKSKYKIVTLIMSVLACGSLIGATTATTTLSQTLSGGSLSVSASSNALTFTAQSITNDGSGASVPVGAAETYDIDVADARGTSSTVALKADITPLTYSGNVRPIAVSVSVLNGSLSSTYSQTISSAVTNVTLASATAGYNQHGDLRISITPQALSGTSARAGNYSGSIVVTVE